MTLLWVSPHLDDVALSCGGRLLRALDLGRRVVVASVFTDGGPEHAARRREDAAALRSIGAEAVHLGYADAPARPGLRSTFQSLVLDAAVDEALVDAVGASLRALVAATDAAEVYLPLGVGGHVDHRTVFAAHAMLRDRVAFYEDCPYAFAHPLLALRLRELGVATEPDATTRRALAGAFATLPFLRAYAPTEAERDAAVTTLAARAAAPAPARAMTLRPEVEGFSADELRRVGELIARYESQRADLFGAAEITRPYAEASSMEGAAFTERCHRRA